MLRKAKIWGVVCLFFGAAGCFGSATRDEGPVEGEGEGVELSVTPATLDFGDVVEGQSSALATVTIRATGPTGTLEVSGEGGTSVEGDGCSGKALDAGVSCDVMVSLQAIAAGALESRLRVTDGTVTGEAVLRGNGLSAESALVLSPASFQFPTAIATETQTTQTFTLTNEGDAAVGPIEVTVSASEGSASDFLIEQSTCTTLDAGASCTIDVRFTPAMAQSYLINLRAGHGTDVTLASISAEATQPLRTIYLQHSASGTKDLAVSLCDQGDCRYAWPLGQCRIGCLVSPNEYEKEFYCSQTCKDAAEFRCRASANFFNDACVFEVPMGTRLSVLGHQAGFLNYSGCDDLVDRELKDTTVRTCVVELGADDSYVTAHYSDK